jgi:membrane protein
MKFPEVTGKLTAWELLSTTWRNIIRHEVLTRTSAIAFSSMMASVPFLILALTAFIYLLPELSGAADGVGLGIGNLTPEQVREFLLTLFPPDIANVITDQITHIQEQPPIGLISISIVVLLWMASAVFVDIMDALNKIYGVKETRPYWHVRLWAILITIIQMAIGLVALIVLMAWPQIMNAFHLTGDSAYYATIIKWIVVPVTVMGSMALIFRMGPASHQRGRWVTPGSVFGTIIFLAATLLFREYVLKFASYNRIYGSLGGVMALMFWFWLSSLVLLVAAEMNKVIEYAVTRTKKPTENTKSAGGKEEAPVVKTDILPEAGPQGQATAVNPQTTIPPSQANSAGSVDPANGSPVTDGTANVTVTASTGAAPVEKNTKGDSNA